MADLLLTCSLNKMFQEMNSTFLLFILIPVH